MSANPEEHTHGCDLLVLFRRADGTKGKETIGMTFNAGTDFSVLHHMVTAYCKQKDRTIRNVVVAIPTVASSWELQNETS